MEVGSEVRSFALPVEVRGRVRTRRRYSPARGPAVPCAEKAVAERVSSVGHRGPERPTPTASGATPAAPVANAGATLRC